MSHFIGFISTKVNTRQKLHLCLNILPYNQIIQVPLLIRYNYLKKKKYFKVSYLRFCWVDFEKIFTFAFKLSKSATTTVWSKPMSISAMSLNKPVRK